MGALSIPIILHPALDTSFEDLQISLVNITKSYHQLTPLAAYRQCMKAFGEVNDSMFMDPMDCEAKGDAFNRLVAAIFKNPHSSLKWNFMQCPRGVPPMLLA